MPSFFSLVVGCGCAVLLSWSVVTALVRKAPKLGLLDRPNERSLHAQVTPRGGGIGVVLAVLLLSIGWMMSTGEVLNGPDGLYLGAAFAVAAVSLWDDFHSLGVAVRLLCHFAAAGAVLLGLGGFCVVAFPSAGVVELGVLGLGLTAIWIVGLTNIYNFMDGIDGIAGVQGLVAALVWIVAGWWLQSSFAMVLAVLLAGGCAGFLVHNWAPAKIFMGDVGSAFLGFSFAVLPLLAIASSQAATELEISRGRLPVFAALVVWPFLGDGLFTFCRRALNKERVWTAHRSHLYQRLVQTGWSHARVASLYGMWALLSGAVGLSYLVRFTASTWPPLSFMVLSLAGLAGFVCQRERTQAKHQTRGA